jgi:hypothetical protein
MLTLSQLTRRVTANIPTKHSPTDNKEDSNDFEMTAFYFPELPIWVKSSEHFYSENVDGRRNCEYQVQLEG